MSKCTNQQLTVLAAVSGCLAVMLTPGTVSQVVRREFIQETKEVMDDTIAYWETSGDDVLNFAIHIQPAIIKWHEFLESQRRIRLTPVNLACMSARVIQDQLDRCNNRRKLEMLNGIASRIEIIHSYFDADASNIVAFEEAGLLMDFLYKMVDWDFDWRK